MGFWGRVNLKSTYDTNPWLKSRSQINTTKYRPFGTVSKQYVVDLQNGRRKSFGFWKFENDLDLFFDRLQFRSKIQVFANKRKNEHLLADLQFFQHFYFRLYRSSSICIVSKPIYELLHMWSMLHLSLVLPLLVFVFFCFCFYKLIIITSRTNKHWIFRQTLQRIIFFTCKIQCVGNASTKCPWERCLKSCGHAIRPTTWSASFVGSFQAILLPWCPTCWSVHREVADRVC